jgi:hypothetical protein
MILIFLSEDFLGLSIIYIRYARETIEKPV